MTPLPPPVGSLVRNIGIVEAFVYKNEECFMRLRNIQAGQCAFEVCHLSWELGPNAHLPMAFWIILP
jgi:hypothetical protein